MGSELSSLGRNTKVAATQGMRFFKNAASQARGESRTSGIRGATSPEAVRILSRELQLVESFATLFFNFFFFQLCRVSRARVATCTISPRPRAGNVASVLIDKGA